jgi:hypothetical protein
MQSLDVKLNLLQTKVYFLLGKLLGLSKDLPTEKGMELMTIVKLIDEELDKFIKSFSEKK